jgi:GNAT superfamily N-acetyltransferase
MLALAADWRPDSRVRSIAEVLADASVAHYAAGWPRAGDDGVVAQDAEGLPVGAAWWRFFTADDPGYGFVDSDVPEVSVAVLPEHRGQGLGRVLMRQLVELAQDKGLSGLSLSVERDNFAMVLYRELGFVEVGGSPGAATMLLGFQT